MAPALQKDDAYQTAANSQDGSEDGNIATSVPKLPDRYADESYKLFSKVQVSDPTAEEAALIRNKLLWRILPFLCIGYHLMYVDKQTVCVKLGNSVSQAEGTNVCYRHRNETDHSSLCSWVARPSWAY